MWWYSGSPYLDDATSFNNLKQDYKKQVPNKPVHKHIKLIFVAIFCNNIRPYGAWCKKWRNKKLQFSDLLRYTCSRTVFGSVHIASQWNSHYRIFVFRKPCRPFNEENLKYTKFKIWFLHPLHPPPPPPPPKKKKKKKKKQKQIMNK